MEEKNKYELAHSVTSAQWVKNVSKLTSPRRTLSNPNYTARCARRASPRNLASRSIWSRCTTWPTKVYRGCSLWSTPVSGPRHKLQEHPLVVRDKLLRIKRYPQQPYLPKRPHQIVAEQQRQRQRVKAILSLTSWATLTSSGSAMMVRNFLLSHLLITN